MCYGYESSQKTLSALRNVRSGNHWLAIVAHLSYLSFSVVVSLQVHYTPEYPDELPNLQLEALEGEITDEEQEFLIEGMKTAGTESLGMAMVFTLTSWLSQALVGVLDDRARKLKEAEDKKFAEYEEVRNNRAHLRLRNVVLRRQVYRLRSGRSSKEAWYPGDSGDVHGFTKETSGASKKSTEQG